MTQELKGVTIYPGAKVQGLPDTKIDWYDFGGGNLIAPSVPVDDKSKDTSIAALNCIRKGLYYFKVLEGYFTEEDLPNMFKEYAPAFAEEVEKKTQEMTQNE